MSRASTVIIDDSSDRATGKGVSTLSLTAGILHVWGIRSCLSLCDQGLYSGSTFLLNVLLARWLTKEAYGAFAVSFAGLLFLTGFHNVMFIEPMMVIGPSCYAKHLTDYFSRQLRAHLILVGSLSVVAMVAGGVLALLGVRNYLPTTIVAAGIGSPFLLLLWLTRRMCYVVVNPLMAMEGSAAYMVLILGGVIGLRHLSWITPATAFLWIGGVSLLVSVFILWRLRVPLTPIASPWLRQLLRENWGYGRWLTLTTALSWISVQAQTFLAAGFIGLAGAGVLRAMQLPSLAMMQVTAATTLLVLPSMSKELASGNVARLRKKAILSSACLSILGGLFAVGLFLFTAPIERTLFGGRYAYTAWLIPVLGLVPIFTGFSSSLSLALRALRKAHFELIAYVFSAVTALGLAFLLMPRWGLQGAAASLVGSAAALAVAVLICFLKWGTA